MAPAARRRNRSYHPDTLTDYWIDMCRTAGVPRIRLHDARHTCGTLMHLQKVPTAVIAEWLGHTDSAFTMRRYVHSQDDALRAAAKTWNTVVTACDNSPKHDQNGEQHEERKMAG
jgi:integrase